MPSVVPQSGRSRATGLAAVARSSYSIGVSMQMGRVIEIAHRLGVSPQSLHGCRGSAARSSGGRASDRPGVARLGVGQGLLVPVRVARSWEAEHRPLPGRGPLDDLLIVRRSCATHGEVRRTGKRPGFLPGRSSRPPPRRTSPRGGSS